MLVERIVEHLFQQHIDAVVGVRAVAQLADIHTGTATDVLFPVEGLDGVGAIFQVDIYMCIFFHKILSCRLCTGFPHKDNAKKRVKKE